MKWIPVTLGALSVVLAATSGGSAYEDWRRELRQREAVDGLNELFSHMKGHFGEY